ncbi:MAG TPA: YrdB family protein [Anaerolineales bacterium]|nr:YrdB family protein [Anaerolineales bacterium]
MDILKTLNLGVRFLLELCMLVAVGYWGFKTHSGWALKIILGIGLPILLIVIWSLFVAPKAAYPLRGLPHIVLSLILLGSGAVALFAAGRAGLGWVYAIVLIVNQVLLMVWKQ